MRIAKSAVAATLGVGVLLAVPAPLSARQSPAVNPSASADEWRAHGRDATEQRYSPLDRITRLNVGRLGVAWSWESPRRGARLESKPLVADGVM